MFFNDNCPDENPVVAIANTCIRKDNIAMAEQCLIENGIDPEEACVVLQALGYILLDTEMYPEPDG